MLQLYPLGLWLKAEVAYHAGLDGSLKDQSRGHLRELKYVDSQIPDTPCMHMYTIYYAYIGVVWGVKTNH